MSLYPAFLNLSGKTVVIVGGGHVAQRKVDSLLETGCHIKLVSPKVNEALYSCPHLEILERNYTSKDLAGASLAIAATSDIKVNKKIREDADKRGIFCNVVDDHELCSFMVPSLIERGPIQIAISTGGASPALARRLRMDLGRHLGDEYEVLAQIMSRVRPLVREQEGGADAHRRVFNILIDSELIELIKEGDREGAEELLEMALGQRVQLEDLI